MQFGVGQPVPRTEDPKFLMGQGHYVDDIRIPHTAVGYVLRRRWLHVTRTAAAHLDSAFDGRITPEQLSPRERDHELQRVVIDEHGWTA